MAAILTLRQKQTLQAIASTSLAKNFYFTGGTALAHFYLQHRRSEDLDFFNPNEFQAQDITPILKSMQKMIGYQTFDLQTSFNRHIYQLKFKKDFLKIEFTYFPFTQVETPQLHQGILVDNLIDIAVNKLFTIAQNPRGRDYYDLYCIEQKKHFGLEKLRLLAKEKFDWHVDVLQLGSQLIKANLLLDDPILTKAISKTKIVNFFNQQAFNLKSEILSNKS